MTIDGQRLTLIAQVGGPSTAQRGGLFYGVLRALRAIGKLSDNHSLSRRQEQRLLRREATEVSDQEMAMQQSTNGARSGIAESEFQSLGPTQQKDRSPTVCNLKLGPARVGVSDDGSVRAGT